MKILFISRAYPPIVGGIENQNYGIAHSLSKIAEVKIVANKKGKKNLPLFLPFITIRSLFIAKKYDMILFGDGVLSPIGAILKFFYPQKTIASIIHGLDITFAHKESILGKVYRTFNIPSHKKLDKLIMVGNEAAEEAVKVGIPRGKCVFIPNGLFPEEVYKYHTREEMEKVLGIISADKKIILRTGRFVKHKGQEWFIKNVMPKLPDDYVLVCAGGRVAKKTAGDEDNYEACVKAIKENGLEKRVILITNIPEKDKLILLNTIDLFVSPNIKVHGSMEGFGITSIEAAVCGRVVLASNLEGLKDSVADGQSGFLIEHENTDAWVNKINELLADDNYRKEFGEKARQFVIENYSWDKIAQKYLEEIESVISKSKI